MVSGSVWFQHFSIATGHRMVLRGQVFELATELDLGTASAETDLDSRSVYGYKYVHYDAGHMTYKNIKSNKY